jgi:hypothetical protein
MKTCEGCTASGTYIYHWNLRLILKEKYSQNKMYSIFNNFNSQSYTSVVLNVPFNNVNL